MERLLADAEKLTGVKYDINNLDDVFNAIHAIQGELGITGVAASEANQTLEGSFNAMKASYNDFLGNLALGESIKEPLANLITTTGTFLVGNLIPMVINVCKALPGALVEALSILGPVAIGEGKKLMESLGIGLSDASPLKGLGQKLQTNLNPVFDSLKTSFEFLPTMFQTVAPKVLEVVEIIGGGLGRLDFSGLAKLASAFLPALTKGFETFVNIVKPAISQLVDSFVNLWNKIQPVLAIVAGALIPIFQILASFLGGVVKGAMFALSGTFDILAGVISFLTPVFRVLIGVVEKFSPILSKIAEWIGVAIGMFANFGGSANSLKDILKSAWDNICEAFKFASGLIHGSISIITGVFTNLKSAGTSLKNALQSAWTLITSSISSASFSIRGLVGKVKDVFNSLKNINLFDAGKAILRGFLNGLKAVWGSVTSFVGGIAGWIKAHKGPISYDRKLLVPAGNAIMQGLDRGLASEFAKVKGTVNSMANEIYEGFDIGVKPVDILADGFRLTDDKLDKVIGPSIDANIGADSDRRASKIDARLGEILRLLQVLIDKDEDVYIDGEKVSSILNRKIDEYRKRKELYDSRRGGILVDV